MRHLLLEEVEEGYTSKTGEVLYEDFDHGAAYKTGSCLESKDLQILPQTAFMKSII